MRAHTSASIDHLLSLNVGPFALYMCGPYTTFVHPIVSSLGSSQIRNKRSGSSSRSASYRNADPIAPPFASFSSSKAAMAGSPRKCAINFPPERNRVRLLRILWLHRRHRHM